MPNTRLSMPFLVKVMTLILVATSPLAHAKFDLDAFKTSIVSGAFYTDQTDIEGVVVPWRLVVNYEQKVHPDIDIAVRMNSQTGITSGPYIDGFNTETEKFRIETIKYTQNLSESLKTRVGFGKIKANVLKKGGSTTPMPFSNAMSRLPLKPSDVAWGIQQTPSKFNGSYSIGAAVSDVSTQTKPDDRNYSLFGELYTAESYGSMWLQYSQNNLVKIIDSDHYFSLGGDRIFDDTALNATVYVGVQKGFMGFDCGYKTSKMKDFYDANLGVGYGYSRDLQKTLEISLDKQLIDHFTTTLSWYHQWPDNAKSFNVVGIKIEHSF